MYQVQQRWKVAVKFSNRELVFWINENHLSNVLRKVADLQFTENGLETPESLTVVSDEYETARSSRIPAQMQLPI